eukprot:6185818-Pleurochrysis_carterae.AAC.3
MDGEQGAAGGQHAESVRSCQCALGQAGVSKFWSGKTVHTTPHRKHACFHKKQIQRFLWLLIRVWRSWAQHARIRRWRCAFDHA